MLFIFAVLGIVLLIVGFKLDVTGKFNYLPLVTLISGMFLFLTSAIAAACIMKTKYVESEQTAEYQLVALDNDGHMVYHFIMDDGEGYSFHYQDNDDIKYATVQSTDTKISKVDVNNAVLREYIDYTKIKISEPASKFWFFQSNTLNSQKRYEAFVPQDSIIDVDSLQASE